MTMMDKFARETATFAHQRLTETERELRHKLHQLEITIARRSVFHNRCHLCGAPCSITRRYCHAHSWAEGDE